ncbi:GntR family transcriptional regulator [Lentilactobacillus hilgardii]|uniref:Transcriptional regulator, GntR family n=1 Tax=Lentilactobacillus hilgardii (strain ATCC 8290 / DSM 20176 / CCUG 30140 / JCM 1155 / KCTC 3500 / NBRC 15886 / NCIMB 8040 / NRRL B-1843 / 9) TaxID=1423757 RepID=C0XGH6_LENH9|nr:GntR family transcriptional regulator [Lentilactobacillus hilgardii]EEI19671.1 transcriptional regulator, GntR family [Lentilactobacillus buchneri ATCC 11577]EEI25520.1 transcriptional regulator, GntR family [Lentilactobacillus hilgardii DSM 20176 = ATCC 8290]KRK56627.1 GntR family transcriptional regulator [Lentilactobacillus hilgardii DSM 20176 = ATCC 8290]MCT3395254.1 GntR family transcriptional regulator [Lentilactobacillus hilgardii]QEU39458.1 GntR family transcriptional regulator [Len
MDNMRSDAYNEIKHKIIHFDYSPGEKISEKTISSELKLGRTPVREAIIRIEREGLIKVIPQSGTYITRIDMSDVKNARFVRSCIEPRIMVDATVKMTSQVRNILEDNLNSQAKASASKDADTFFNLDQDFHHEFYKIILKNSVWQWLEINNTQLNRFQKLLLKEKNFNWNRLLAQHRQILSAVLNQNIDDLIFLVNQHIHLTLLEKQRALDDYPDYFKN